MPTQWFGEVSQNGKEIRMIKTNRNEKILIFFLLFGIIASAGYFFFSNSDFNKPGLTTQNGLVVVPPQLATRDVADDGAASANVPTLPPSAVVEIQKTLVEPELKVPTSDNLEKKQNAITEKAEILQVPVLKSAIAPVKTVVPEPAISPVVSGKKTNPEFWVWIGGGMNFQYYKQSVPNINGEATFQNIQGPTALVNAGTQSETWGLDLSYKQTPGKMSSSSTVTVTNGNYNWRTLSAEGLYRKDDNWNFRLGFQHHLMPFMALDAASAVLDVKSNSLTMFTVGFNRSHFLVSNKLRGEWQMRYQHPLLSGSTDSTSFSVKPKFAFDGSVGSVYSLSDTSRIGLFWYGQWHQYSFDYGSGANAFSGNQTLFYSNIEIRLGFEF